MKNTNTNTNNNTNINTNNEAQMKNSLIWNEATAAHRAELRKLRCEALAKLNASATWTDAIASVKRGNALFAEKKAAETANLDDVIAQLKAKAKDREEKAKARKKAFIAKMKTNCSFTSAPWAFVLANTTEKQRKFLLTDPVFVEMKEAANALKAEADRKKEKERKKEERKAKAEAKAQRPRMEAELAKKNATKAERIAQKAARETSK